jgi:hypothetical protein
MENRPADKEGCAGVLGRRALANGGQWPAKRPQARSRGDARRLVPQRDLARTFLSFHDDDGGSLAMFQAAQADFLVLQLDARGFTAASV